MIYQFISIVYLSVMVKEILMVVIFHREVFIRATFFSPYLFIIASFESLFRLLKKFELNRDIHGIRIIKESPFTSYLMLLMIF